MINAVNIGANLLHTLVFSFTAASSVINVIHLIEATNTFCSNLLGSLCRHYVGRNITAYGLRWYAKSISNVGASEIHIKIVYRFDSVLSRATIKCHSNRE